MDLELLLFTTVVTAVLFFFAVVRIWRDLLPQKQYYRIGTYAIAMLALLMMLVRESDFRDDLAIKIFMPVTALSVIVLFIYHIIPLWKGKQYIRMWMAIICAAIVSIGSLWTSYRILFM